MPGQEGELWTLRLNLRRCLQPPRVPMSRPKPALMTGSGTGGQLRLDSAPHIVAQDSQSPNLRATPVCSMRPVHTPCMYPPPPGQCTHVAGTAHNKSTWTWEPKMAFPSQNCTT